MIRLQQRAHHERKVQSDLAHQFPVVERDDGQGVTDDGRVFRRAVNLAPEAFCKVGNLGLAPFDEACDTVSA